MFLDVNHLPVPVCACAHTSQVNDCVCCLCMCTYHTHMYAHTRAPPIFPSAVARLQLEVGKRMQPCFPFI